MVNGSRADMRRIDQEQNNRYKRTLTFIILLITVITMITVTFLNPMFMKKQIKNSNNQAIIVRQVNGNFDALADLIGAKRESDSNLLTVQQTQPIADHIIDYSLGLHWIKIDSTSLAQQILNDIDKNVDSGSSGDGQNIRKKLKKQGSNAAYFVARAFNLNVVTLGANIAVLLFVVNIIIVIITIIALFSLISDMKLRSSVKALVHDVTGAGMWAGFWMILFFGIFSIIPVIFNVETLPFVGIGYLLEISSGIFLDYVILGVIIYILCAIPWQSTTPE